MKRRRLETLNVPALSRWLGYRLLEDFPTVVRVRHGLMGWFVMSFQRIIMPNRKLYVLITYMVLGPPAPWAPGGRTACPSLRAGPAKDNPDVILGIPFIHGCGSRFKRAMDQHATAPLDVQQDIGWYS
jgi:hypothetical protein